MITLKLIAITFVWVMGIKISTADEMVFERLGKWGQRKVDEGHKIYEALMVCPWCLPSIHSLVGYAFAFGLNVIPFEWDWKLLIRYPLVVMGTSFLSGNIWNIYETINRVKERNEAQTDYYNSLLQNNDE